jgi:hypothetical protein
MNYFAGDSVEIKLVNGFLTYAKKIRIFYRVRVLKYL